MDNTIRMECNPVFETIGLLVASSGYEHMKEDMIQSLDRLGLDGKKLYDSKLNLFEKYVATFRKHCSIHKGEAFYFDYQDNNLVMIFTILLLEYKQDRNKIDSDDNSINKKIIQICNNLFDSNESLETASSLEKIIEFLDKTKLTESENWKLMRIMQNPKFHLDKLMELIENNRFAYEKAWDAVSSQMKALIKQYEKSVSNNEVITKLTTSVMVNADIYPTLSQPLGMLVLEKKCFYGVFCHLVLDNNTANSSKEQLLLCLKALSDKSKFDILCRLKVSPQYNLEIAEQMGLSAATMSHHMGVLLSCGLVTVSKKDGRVYYCLDKQAVSKFIEDLKVMLNE